MRYVALIAGLSGRERFLAEGKETDDERKAKRFTSQDAAEKAAEAHINAFPAAVARNLKATVKPWSRGDAHQ